MSLELKAYANIRTVRWRLADAASIGLLLLASCLWPSDSPPAGPVGGGNPAAPGDGNQAISPSTSVLTVSDTTIPSGSQATITLRLRNSSGANIIVPDHFVRFVAYGGTSTGTIGKAIGNQDSTYAATFVGVLAGTSTSITAQVTADSQHLPNGSWRPITVTVWQSGAAVTVLPGPISPVASAVKISEPDLMVGDTATVTLLARDAAGNKLKGLHVVLTTTASDTTGRIGTTSETVAGNYSASFTATHQGYTSFGADLDGASLAIARPSVLVKYSPLAAPGITITPRGATITNGPVQLTAILRDSGGNVIPVSDFNWATLNPYVASIDQRTGEVTANVASGQVVVSATAGGTTGYAVINVAVPSGIQAAQWTGFVPPWEVPYCDGGDPYIRCPRIFGVWGSSPTDVYAGGTSGVIYHFDGSGWQRQLATGQEIGSFWGAASNDVYAIAGGLPFHNGGTGWSRLSAAPLYAMTSIWGSAPNDVYATASGLDNTDMNVGGVWHYDGRTWALGSWYPLSNIWGLSAIDMYASWGGLPYHFDGRRWSQMPNSTGVSCDAFWGTSPTNIYCVSPRQVWKFNGSSWTALNPPVTTGACTCNTSSLRRIWGTSETDIYVVGAYAQLFGFDGTSWHVYKSHFESDEYDLNNVWAIGNDVFSVGDAGYGYRGTP